MSVNHPFVLGIDAGGTKTRALLADHSGSVIAAASGPGANLRTHGELQVEKVLHSLVERTEAEAGVRAEAIALGIAGADRPDDQEVLRAILRRMGFKERVVVTNDARIAFVAGSQRRVGLALVCGTGSIAWGRNSRGEIARAGGWGWHVGDEGSGFWIGERAIRAALRASDGRGSETALTAALLEHFGLAHIDQLVRRVYDSEYPRHEVALFAVRVAAAAAAGDAVAASILGDAARELVLAAESVVARLGLGPDGYDVVLSGGTFAALPALQREVTTALSKPGASIVPLEVEPAAGAVRLALEALKS
ncbi:MAG TPA: BadF/BadG/BcrA/BcrD ATPase family protein [Thermoanaerobaculia bacterium]|nr:BadF/BadG/BcrA/BcrD ATPase family protein [Thermoanaerobaculia bacterium]